MNFVLPITVLFLFSSFSFAKPNKKITFLIAEREYQTESSIPKFIDEHLQELYTTLICSAANEGSQRHHLSNPNFISNADLLFFSVRRRAFSKKVMHSIRKHIDEGKPILGIRTASHAFELRKESLSAGHQEWKEWDREVIGGNYNGHLGKGLICSISPHLETNEHFILEGVKLPFSTPATLYRNSPLPNRSLPLLIGSVKGYPSEPVAWTHKTMSDGRVFYTSLGHIEDFQKPSFNQLLKNAIKWCLNK